MKTFLKTVSPLLLLLWLTTTAFGSERETVTPPPAWTVRHAVLFAIKNNPDISMAMERLKGAKASVVMEKSSFYPTLSLTTRYSQTNNPMYSFGNILNQGAFNPTLDFNNPGRTDDLNMGLRVNYNLYNGGRDQAGINSAEAMEEGTNKQIGALQDELAFAAIRAFNMIIQAEGVAKAYRSTLDAIESSLSVAVARFNEGVLLRTDLLNLEVQQSQSEENLIQANNKLSVSQKMFLNLMGLKDGHVSIIAESANEQIIPETRSYEDRFEIQVAEAKIKGAEAQLRKAHGGNYPSVEGFAGYDYDYGSVTDKEGDSWLAGIQLSYNLYDGKRTSSAVKVASAVLAEAKENLRKTELAIELETKRAELSLNDADSRLKVTNKGVHLAEESAKISRARFKEGEILTSDLIEVENRLTDALLRRTVAKTSRNIAIAGLRKALGLPQFENQNINNQ